MKDLVGKTLLARSDIAPGFNFIAPDEIIKEWGCC